MENELEVQINAIAQSWSDYSNYFLPAMLNVLEKPLEVESTKQFAEMLRMNYRPGDPMPEELKSLLQKLAGPYGKALYKACLIKRGLP